MKLGGHRRMSLTSKINTVQCCYLTDQILEGGSHDESKHDSAAGEDETGEF